MIENLRYYSDRASWVEMVAFDVTRDGNKIPLTASIPLLIAGLRSFDREGKITLTYSEVIEILEFYKAECQKISAKEKVKTYNGWYNSGIREFDSYASTGDEVDESIIDHFAGCVPPLVYSYGLVQCGEPYDTVKDKNGKLRYTYATFAKENGKWLYKGHCFKNSTEDCGKYDGVMLIIECYKNKIKEENDESKEL